MAIWIGWLTGPLFYGLLALAWCRYRPALTVGFRARLPWSLGLSVLSALGLLCVVPGRLFEERAGDSLFTLQPLASLAVATLALVLIVAGWVLAFEVAVRLCRWGQGQRRRRLALAANLALLPLCFLLLHSLAPQVFYLLYRLLLPGLPAQWVIAAPWDLAPLVAALALGPGSSLSSLASGLAFWSLLAPTLLVHACSPSQQGP
ncbi:MAG: hypothetical protein Kilf2KO_08820 [Rhodospirillales bacterium]